MFPIRLSSNFIVDRERAYIFCSAYYMSENIKLLQEQGLVESQLSLLEDPSK